MIKNYFTIAWRNLMKSKVFSFINVLGLTIGITVCMMIFLFIMHEMSFDRFHSQAASIYRVMRNVTNDNKEASVGWLSGPYGPALQNDFKGQITNMVRVRPDDDLVTPSSPLVSKPSVRRGPIQARVCERNRQSRRDFSHLARSS